VELPLDVVLSHILGLRLNMARRVSYSSKAVELATLSSPKTDDRRPPGTGALSSCRLVNNDEYNEFKVVTRTTQVLKFSMHNVQ